MGWGPECSAYLPAPAAIQGLASETEDEDEEDDRRTFISEFDSGLETGRARLTRGGVLQRAPHHELGELGRLPSAAGTTIVCSLQLLPAPGSPPADAS